MLVPLFENTLKLTPSRHTVAPSGWLLPNVMSRDRSSSICLLRRGNALSQLARSLLGQSACVAIPSASRPKASAVAQQRPAQLRLRAGLQRKCFLHAAATSRSTVFSVWRSVLTRFGSSLIVCLNSGLSRIPSTEASVCSTEPRPARPGEGGTIAASSAPSRVRSALQQGPESTTASATRLRD